MEHFALISKAMRGKDLWDETDGFYYDVLRDADGVSMPCGCARWSASSRCSPRRRCGRRT